MGAGRQKVVVQITGGSGSPPDYNLHWLTANIDDLANIQNGVDYLGVFYDAIKAWYPFGTHISVGSQVVEYANDPHKELAVTPVTVNGTDSSGFCPPQCAVVVSWQTATAQRWGRGRSYIGPVGRAGETTNGTPTPAFVTALQDAASTLVNDLSVAGCGKAIFNPVGPNSISEVIRGVVRGGSFHTQRRRAVK